MSSVRGPSIMSNILLKRQRTGDTQDDIYTKKRKTEQSTRMYTEKEVRLLLDEMERRYNHQAHMYFNKIQTLLAQRDKQRSYAMEYIS